MKLQVQNLGPIKFGEIDLSKRFYVFVGYNNSGKTYMGQLLWSLFALKKEEYSHHFINKVEDLNGEIEVSESDLKKVVEEFQEFLQKSFLQKTLNLNKGHFLGENLKLNIVGDYVKEFHENKCLIRAASGKRGNYVINKNSNKNKFRISQDIIFEEGELNFLDMGVDDENSIINWANQHLFASVLDTLFEKARYSVFFLPANRNFYPNFYKYIYSVSKDEKDKIAEKVGNGGDLESVKALLKRPYTQPMDELNTRVFKLNNDRTSTGYYEDLLMELEEIIGGEIEIISVEGIAPIEFRLKIAEGKSLDMHVASSSSNQLTTLYLYLKYWARESNNFLIIDDPEENLHPKNQLKLLELLIKFSKRNNNRILITTHSTLLSDSINNHLHLGHLKQEGFDLEEVAKEKVLHIDVNTALEPDETGVYFFNGERIFEYDVNDYGVVFGDFVKEEHKVRDDSSALKGLIFEHQNNKLEEVSNA